MESIKELRKICQNKGYQEHISLRFFRIFSIYITKIFLILGLRPNFITILGFLIAIAGGYLYIIQQFLLGSILFFISLFLDHVDGEIARYRKLSSVLGEWLDTTTVHFLYPYFFFTLGLGIFFQTQIIWYALLGALAAMLKLIERSIPKPVIPGTKTDGDNQQLLTNQEVFLKQEASSIKLWLNHIVKIQVLCPVILLCSFLGWERWFLWFFTIYLVLFVLSKVFLTGWRIHHYE